MKFDPLLLSTISDLFTNLSAGWFGAAIIIPVNTKNIGKVRYTVLLINLLFAIFSLVGAYILKKQL